MISFTKGLFDCLGGFGLIFRPGIKRFVLLPLLVNIALFSVATKLLFDHLDSWLEQLLPDFLSLLEWLIWPLFALAMSLIVFYSFTIFANLIAAPFNSLLSSRIEASLTGRAPEVIDPVRLLKLTQRTIRSEVQKLLYAIRWFIPLTIFTLIPFINVISPLLWMLFAAWFFALEYHEYPLANRGLFFDEVRTFNRENRMRSLGLGTGIFLITSIPLLNLLAMPVAVTAATRSSIRIREAVSKKGQHGKTAE